MKKKKKIYITGCAKSGTTLVRRLFNAFELDVYNYYEMSIDSFMESKYNVAKRKYNTILSRKLDKKEESRQLEIIKNIFIVNVVRNKADVLKSDNGYVPEARYDSCMEQASRLSDDIDFTLSYDDLLCDPDRAQEKISEKSDMLETISFGAPAVGISSFQHPSCHHKNAKIFGYPLKPIIF